MRKVALFVVMLIASFSLMAQDYVGTFFTGVHWPMGPKEFWSDNKAYMVIPYGDSYAGYDSVAIYNSNMQRVNTVNFPVFTFNSCDYRDHYYSSSGSWIMGTPNWQEAIAKLVIPEFYDADMGVNDCKIFISESLFNNDSKIEYIMPYYDGEFVYENEVTGGLERRHIPWCKGFNIMNEDGEIVATIRGTGNENYKVLDCSIWRWDGKWFFASRAMLADGSTALYLYRIDRQTQKIEQVASVPFSVRPTVMERGQEIIVELDENTNAREIDVVNALGQTVKRVPVAAGQREVRINSAELGSGMNFINTRTPEGQGTVKIIVK